MKKLAMLVLLSISVFAYTNCTACHNGGYKSKLNQYTPDEIATMMNQYKNAQRSGMMSRIAKSMSEEELKEVSIRFGKK